MDDWRQIKRAASNLMVFDGAECQMKHRCRQAVHQAPVLRRVTLGIYIHTRTNTYSYEYMHAYYTSMITSERLSQFDLEIHEVGY
jgi:hypothetical protein